MKPTLIFETVHGSRAYNLQRPESDTDFKGIIVGPAAWYHSFRKGPEQIEKNADHVRFEIRKFFRLAAASNPTTIEMLWTDPEDHLTVTPAGEQLINSRELFLSRRVQETFAGYALSQMKRILTHRRWLLKPPAAEPARIDFGLPKRRAVSGNQLGAAFALQSRGDLNLADFNSNFLELLEKEKQYKQARKEWKQYHVWLKERNQVRAGLEAKFGYDTKHAMHLVRLQRMAVEILAEKKVFVRRTDRDELLAIRDGIWTYDQLMEQCEALGKKINEAAESSSLPEQPDAEQLETLCVSIVEEVLNADS